jgi:sulfite reductase beta subunit-like hemoprotein
MPGYYALHVGGDFEGTRLSQRLLDKMALADIPDTLEPLFADFAFRRNPSEGFGDFCHRRRGALADADQGECATSSARWLKGSETCDGSRSFHA